MIAAALAVVPQVWPQVLKPHPWAVGLFVFIGGLLFAYGALGHERPEGGTTQNIKAPITPNANPTITNSPTFTNAPVFAPQIVIPISGPTIHPPVTPRPDDARHNVVFLGADFVKISYSGPGFSDRTDGMHSFDEVHGNSNGDMIGLVARFRNEAIYGQNVKPVSGARAHVKLFDTNNQEIGTGFSSALWMGHSTDTFDLIPNGAGGSVLVYWGSSDPKSTVKAVACWKTGDARVRLRDKDIHLDEHPRRAEVTIMDYNHRPLLKPVILEIANAAGKFSVSARQ
jgi:hypothetical protein